MILYLSIPRLLRLFRLFHVESWTVLSVSQCHQQREWDDVLFALHFLIISIWNSSWMYFTICFKHITVLVISFNPLSSCRVPDKEAKLNWEKVLLVWIGKGLFHGPPQRYFSKYHVKSLIFIWLIEKSRKFELLCFRVNYLRRRFFTNRIFIGIKCWLIRKFLCLRRNVCTSD